LYSRNGTHAYEPRSEYLGWYNVDWMNMDKVTYPRTEECKIDHYNIVEDSYNVPILQETGKYCVDFWRFGKSIFSSLELCADYVKGNRVNCAVGQGYFFYSESEKLCRCCTDPNPTIVTKDSNYLES
jgi:hypothetical protein